MTALKACLRRLLLWLEPAAPTPGSVQDQIGDHLRAAVAADERAKANNTQTHKARVDAMIEDFFSKYEDRDARHHH